MTKNSLKNKKIVMMVANDFTFDARVLKEARSAQKAGMKVFVLARKSPTTKFREKIDGIQVIRVQTWLDLFWSKIARSLGQSPIAKSQNNHPNRIIVYAVLLNFYFLNKLFMQEALKIKPDLVHSNDSTTLTAAYRLKKSGFKVVFDAHEIFSESLAHPDPIWRAFYRRLEKKLSQVDGIFSVCQSILDELDRRYKTQNIPKAILYNAPPYLKKTLRKLDGQIKLLFIGTSYPMNDFKVYFKTIAPLKNTTLTNIGLNWGQSDLPKITNRSMMPYDQLIDEIGHYDIGIIPYVPDNLNNAFSTPNKLFSYMLGGLAIASSDLVEIRKIVKKVDNGVLFNSKDTKDMVKKIKWLVNHPDQLRKFKQNSLQAAKEYCWENQEKKQLKMYREILSND